MSEQNQLPGNKGTGIKSDATAKSEKKTNMISPFMFIFDLVFVLCKGNQIIINIVVFLFNKNTDGQSHSDWER